MREPAYIVIADDGHITLFRGDGTEADPAVLWQGPPAEDAAQIAAVIDQLTQWAEGNDYRVVVPAYDRQPGNVTLDPTPRDLDIADADEIDQMLDDLYFLDDNENSDRRG